MSDSDEDNEEGEGTVSLAGFLFGNIDMKTGQLEDDILDSESKRQLNALQKFGLGSIIDDVMEGQGQPQQCEKSKKSKTRRLVSSYDSSSDSDDDDDDDDAPQPVSTRTESPSLPSDQVH